jgi:hypothetical protein
LRAIWCVNTYSNSDGNTYRHADGHGDAYIDSRSQRNSDGNRNSDPHVHNVAHMLTRRRRAVGNG